jgi:hypothetical protein
MSDSKNHVWPQADNFCCAASQNNNLLTSHFERCARKTIWHKKLNDNLSYLLPLSRALASLSSVTLPLKYLLASLSPHRAHKLRHAFLSFVSCAFSLSLFSLTFFSRFLSGPFLSNVLFSHRSTDFLICFLRGSSSESTTGALRSHKSAWF